VERHELVIERQVPRPVVRSAIAGAVAYGRGVAGAEAAEALYHRNQVVARREMKQEAREAARRREAVQVCQCGVMAWSSRAIIYNPYVMHCPVP
jgi:hypothetical protein